MKKVELSFERLIEEQRHRKRLRETENGFEDRLNDNQLFFAEIDDGILSEVEKLTRVRRRVTFAALAFSPGLRPVVWCNAC